jgi:hypothetical protein
VDLREGDMLIGVAACVLMWPLVVLWVSGEQALRLFFGGRP